MEDLTNLLTPIRAPVSIRQWGGWAWMPTRIKTHAPPRWAGPDALNTVQRPLCAVRSIGSNTDDAGGTKHVNDFAKVLVACLEQGRDNGRRELIWRHVGASFVEQKQRAVVDEENLFHGGLR